MNRLEILYASAWLLHTSNITKGQRKQKWKICIHINKYERQVIFLCSSFFSSLVIFELRVSVEIGYINNKKQRIKTLKSITRNSIFVINNNKAFCVVWISWKQKPEQTNYDRKKLIAAIRLKSCKKGNFWLYRINGLMVLAQAYTHTHLQLWFKT